MTSPSLSALVAERYGARRTDAHEPAVPDGRGVLRTLLGHRSVRDYSASPIGEETLRLLLAAAQSAASSSNLQLWSVVAIEDPERKRAVSELAGRQRHIVDCPLFLAWIADLHRIAQSSRLPDSRWSDAAVCAATAGRTKPGRKATRGFKVRVCAATEAATSHASSQ